MKNAYPVIFTETEDCVLVEVPDFEILTEGTDLANAIDMARDAIGLKGISLEDDQVVIPQPRKMKDVDISKSTFSEEGSPYVTLVDIDFDAYRRLVDNKMVRRNVTLPNWLNKEAEDAHINVSKVLQEALMSRLGVSR